MSTPSEQIPLFVESLDDAIRAAVQAMGGYKRVGADMKPELAADAAGRWLSDCVNPDRRERLTPHELAYIRRRARQAGIHILAAFEARDAGYAEPVPVEPEDERAALQRAFVESTKHLEQMLRRLQEIGGDRA
ncbi:hypothetical protein [Thermomonas sp.]|uniref:hypothetical protein n=1 Tax=Thermomonas sp. TaxID=1971895 RepID=UPI002614E363|nr:hypothetical protein [Thermomonas sp.]